MAEFERIEQAKGYKFYYLHTDDAEALLSVSEEGYATYLDIEGREVDELILPEGVTSLSHSRLMLAKIKKMVFPKTFKKLYFNSMFAHNKAIEEVIFHKESQVVEIPYRCFALCRNLKKVVLPPSVKKIGESAFGNCQQLCEINIPDGCEIGDCAFSMCKSLSTSI